MQNSIEIIKWTIGGSLATIVIFLIFIRHILDLYTKKYNEFETQLNLKNLERERSILTTRVDVHEETIQKISKELHDNVNQLLTLAKLNLNNIGKSSAESVSSKIEITKDLITKAINELTNMSNSLSSQSIQDLGLLRTLEIESDRIMKINNTEILIEYHLMNNTLSSEEQLILYRIFQEATRNSLTHGKADKINIILREEDKFQFIFEISDNGIGFDITQHKTPSNNRTHQGIKNMIKRASTINATCKIHSTSLLGTIVTVSKTRDSNQ